MSFKKRVKFLNMFGWPYSIFGRDEEWRKTLFLDEVILDCIQTDNKSEWVSQETTRVSECLKIPCWLQIVQTELLFLGKLR